MILAREVNILIPSGTLNLFIKSVDVGTYMTAQFIQAVVSFSFKYSTLVKLWKTVTSIKVTRIRAIVFTYHQWNNLYIFVLNLITVDAGYNAAGYNAASKVARPYKFIYTYTGLPSDSVSRTLYPNFHYQCNLPASLKI